MAINSKISGVTFLILFGIFIHLSPTLAQAAQLHKDEPYTVELRPKMWFTHFDADFKADSGQLEGTTIDVVDDLGFDADKSFFNGEVVLRFSKKHKLIYSYTDMSYSGDAVITEKIVFNGEEYSVSSNINSTLDVTVHHIEYEYDAFYLPGGYLGVTLAVDIFDMSASLSDGVILETASASAPVPSLGFTGRVYFLPTVSGTAKYAYMEVSEGSYQTFEAYLDVTPIRNISITAGYRMIDLSANTDDFEANIKWAGLYAGGVLRF